MAGASADMIFCTKLATRSAGSRAMSAPMQRRRRALDAALCAPLKLTLPAPVDDSAGSARFDKKARVLTVKLPVQEAKDEDGVIL